MSPRRGTRPCRLEVLTLALAWWRRRLARLCHAGLVVQTLPMAAAGLHWGSGNASTGSILDPIITPHYCKVKQGYLIGLRNGCYMTLQFQLRDAAKGLVRPNNPSCDIPGQNHVCVYVVVVFAHSVFFVVVLLLLLVACAASKFHTFSCGTTLNPNPYSLTLGLIVFL